jgi:hypothetical protein
MNTEKVGVITILQEGELVGMIYNNIYTRNRIWYKCVPMTEDEMVAIIEDKVEKKVSSPEA